jgi:hypothetical protein
LKAGLFGFDALAGGFDETPGRIRQLFESIVFLL